MYSGKIVDHFNNPRNVGVMDPEDKDVGISIVGAPSCGDVLQLSIRIDKNDVIVDAKFKAFGCASAIASSSLLTQKLIGKTIEEAMQITNNDIAQELALPPIKLHCSILAQEAMHGAVKNHHEKNS